MVGSSLIHFLWGDSYSAYYQAAKYGQILPNMAKMAIYGRMDMDHQIKIWTSAVSLKRTMKM